MPVHLYGQCADMDAFAAIAKQYSMTIIEDAAQAFGANWRGKKAGTLGTAAAFSFYPTKNLSAAGDGGRVSTDDEELAARVRRLRNHGSRQRYYHEEIGWNSRLDAIQAAVLRVKLKHIDEWNQTAPRNCRPATTRCSAQPAWSRATRRPSRRKRPSRCCRLGRKPSTSTTSTSSALIAAMSCGRFSPSAAIGSEIYYPVPLHLQQSFAYLGYKAGDFPESERAAHEALALPIFPELREDEQQRVVAGDRRVLQPVTSSRRVAHICPLLANVSAGLATGNRRLPQSLRRREHARHLPLRRAAFLRSGKVKAQLALHSDWTAIDRVRTKVILPYRIFTGRNQ